MRALHSLWLSPFCRKVRLVLNEKRLDFEMKTEAVWERNEAFLKLNPAGEVPVLIEADGTALSGSDAICEFLDEVHPEPTLIGRAAMSRAEARRLVYWFDHKFHAEVTKNLVDEKIMKRFLGLGEPASKTFAPATLTFTITWITSVTWPTAAGGSPVTTLAWQIWLLPRTCPASTTWAMCRGSSIPPPRTGLPGSNPARASGLFWRIRSRAWRLRSTTPI